MMNSDNASGGDDWDAQQYGHTATYVFEYGRELLQALAAEQGERILDLGCGHGELACTIRQQGAEVYCVDQSQSMVKACRNKGLNVCKMRAEELDSRKNWQRYFDAVFSNAALHWMPQTRKVLPAVAAVLRPGGRFVAELGGEGNVAIFCRAIAAALQRRQIDYEQWNPWLFPSTEYYRRCLESAGFQVASISLFERPTPKTQKGGEGLFAWLQNFAFPFLKALDPSQHRDFLQEVVEDVASVLPQRDGYFIADYVRLRFVARC